MTLSELKEMIRGEIQSVMEADKSDMEKLDVKLPAQVERHLKKAVAAIKESGLNRRRQIAALARVIDALGLDKNELMRYMSKIKKAI